MKDKKKLLFYLMKVLVLVLIIIFWIGKNNFNFLKFYDAECYLEIAKNGYTYSKLYAFFPLYPLLIKIFSIVFRSYVVSALIINLLCSIISYVIMDKLVDDKNKLWLYIFSPIVVFFSVIYTESLFLMLTLLSFYFYKKNKNIFSSIFVGFSIVTRNTGVLLFIAIIIDYFYNAYKNKTLKIKESIFIIFIPLVIGSLYPLYLFYKTNNLLYFIDVQYIYWGRVSLFFIFGFIDDVKFIVSHGFSLFDIYLVGQNWLWTFYAFYLFIKIFKKDKISSIFGILSIIVFVSSFRDIVYWKTIASISLFRYILSLYPIYLYSNIMNNKFLAFIIRITSLCNMFLYFLGLFVA